MKKPITRALLALFLLSVLLSATALAAGLPFADVAPGDWYYADVEMAYGLGLINGKTATAFQPGENLTYAEAVKLAACMNQTYQNGVVSLEKGDPWYQTYVNYCYAQGIIFHDYEWNQPATRAGYLEIFANALPREALPAINNVADGAIPDVPMTHPQASEIYKLYRAGILQGVDSDGRCNPSASITRGEVAAILTRMMDPTTRKSFSLGQASPSQAEAGPMLYTDVDLGNVRHLYGVDSPDGGICDSFEVWGVMGLEFIRQPAGYAAPVSGQFAREVAGVYDYDDVVSEGSLEVSGFPAWYIDYLHASEDGMATHTVVVVFTDDWFFIFRTSMSMNDYAAPHAMLINEMMYGLYLTDAATVRNTLPLTEHPEAITPAELNVLDVIEANRLSGMLDRHTSVYVYSEEYGAWAENNYFLQNGRLADVGTGNMLTPYLCAGTYLGIYFHVQLDGSIDAMMSLDELGEDLAQSWEDLAEWRFSDLFTDLVSGRDWIYSSEVDGAELILRFGNGDDGTIKTEILDARTLELLEYVEQDGENTADLLNYYFFEYDQDVSDLRQYVSPWDAGLRTVTFVMETGPAAGSYQIQVPRTWELTVYEMYGCQAWMDPGHTVPYTYPGNDAGDYTVYLT